jgi:type IV secretory pathway VirB2 component (pilin)
MRAKMTISKEHGRTALLLMSGLIYTLPTHVFAQTDPMTKTGLGIAGILFGTLGGVICSIYLGSTFIMAKSGKCSWDRFVFVAFCITGFLGTPTLINLARGWIS